MLSLERCLPCMLYLSTVVYAWRSKHSLVSYICPLLRIISFFHQWISVLSAPHLTVNVIPFYGPYLHYAYAYVHHELQSHQGALPNNGASSASESILRLDRTRCRKITTQIFFTVHFIKFSSVQSEASLNSLGLVQVPVKPQVLSWILRACVSCLSIWADCTHSSAGKASCPDSCVRWRQETDWMWKLSCLSEASVGNWHSVANQMLVFSVGKSASPNGEFWIPGTTQALFLGHRLTGFLRPKSQAW